MNPSHSIAEPLNKTLSEVIRIEAANKDTEDEVMASWSRGFIYAMVHSAKPH